MTKIRLIEPTGKLAKKNPRAYRMEEVFSVPYYNPQVKKPKWNSMNFLDKWDVTGSTKLID